MAAQLCVRMLAVRGDVLVFQCKSLSSKSRDHRRGSEVSFSYLTFNRDTQSFSVTGHSMYPLHRDSAGETNILLCSSALDIQQRRKVPCVLLRLCTKKMFKYVLYRVNSPTDAKLLVEFVLPYKMKDNIAICQGPTLVWCHENTVCYVSSQTAGVMEVPVPMTVHFIGELPLRQRKLVIQGVPNVAKQSSDPLNVTGLKNILYFIEDGSTLNSACLVPDAYCSVVQCMRLLSAEELDGSLRSSVLVATSMKQLVYFENGVPLDVCLLPYEEPLSIQMVHTVRNDCLILITFSQGNICAVWKDTFQVCCCWTEVHLVLVEDFVGCGTDQILLVFEEQRSSAELLSSFLLTDLCGITYSCGRALAEAPGTSDTSQENYLLTVKALESRLQSGLNFLEDLQRNVEVKDRLLQQALVALTDLISGREHVVSPPEQEGLVSLWEEDEDEDVGVSDDQMQTERAETRPQVLRVWQRVIGESLVCGVVLTTANHMSVRHISASVVSDGVAVNSRSLTLQSSTSHVTQHQDPPPVKNIRASAETVGSTLTLLTVSDLPPLFTSDTIKCPIMLHYCPDTPLTSPAQLHPVSHCCGRISVNVKDVAMGTFHPRLSQDSSLNTEEAREDLRSLMAVMDTWCVLIQCPDHTLVDVQLWLQEVMHAERLQVDPQYTTAAAGVMLFHWEQKTPFQGLLTVHCRDELHLLQFLNSLCDFLPVSHRMRLVRTPRSRRRPAGLSQTLETEIQTITQEVSSVLQCEERGVKRGASSSSEPLQRLREEWQTERERYNKRLRPLVDATRYCRLLQRLIDTQMNGDVIAVTEAQTDSPRL